MEEELEPRVAITLASDDRLTAVEDRLPAPLALVTVALLEEPEDDEDEAVLPVPVELLLDVSEYSRPAVVREFEIVLMSVCLARKIDGTAFLPLW